MKDSIASRSAHEFHTVVRLGLERIGALLFELGRPDRDLRFVHVAGTNGKGSVCAMISAALHADGHRVGTFTSPNLVRVNERICVDMHEIDDASLDTLLCEVEAAASRVAGSTGEAPTQFEIWCAAAMLHFAREKCDIVVLEVGLGGEFDATNIIERCELAVICHIDLDHTAYLGNTVAEIAKAKCGIIKDDITTNTVVTCEQYDDAMRVIENAAAEHGQKLVVARAPHAFKSEGIYEYFMHGGESVRLGLGGEYQLANAALACAALEALGVSDTAIRTGLAVARHRARFELLAPSLIFDGGHNPDGVGALCASLEKYFKGKKLNIIYACMADKDIRTNLKLLSRIASSFIFTTVAKNPRAMSADALCELARVECGIAGESAPSLAEALERARARDGVSVICGSLYLYGELPHELVK